MAGPKGSQVWILRLDGGLHDGRMVLEGETTDTGGEVTMHRITWTPNANGTVRQLWEVTDTAGGRSVAFDGLYTPLDSQ